MNTSSYTIDVISPDADHEVFRQVAKLHRDEIEGGFLSSLGEKFLTKLYQAISKNPQVVIIAAREGKETLGYLCCAASTAGVYRDFLIKHAWRVAPAIAWKLLSVSKLKRVAETLLYPAKTDDAGLPEPEILNFCVNSNQQRRGIGRNLFSAMCEEFHKRGIRDIRIVTGESQLSAQQFYESLGATKVQEIELHAGAKSIVYTYEIRREQPRANAAA